MTNTKPAKSLHQRILDGVCTFFASICMILFIAWLLPACSSSDTSSAPSTPPAPPLCASASYSVDTGNANQTFVGVTSNQKGHAFTVELRTIDDKIIDNHITAAETTGTALSSTTFDVPVSRVSSINVTEDDIAGQSCPDADFQLGD